MAEPPPAPIETLDREATRRRCEAVVADRETARPMLVGSTRRTVR